MLGFHPSCDVCWLHTLWQHNDFGECALHGGEEFLVTSVHGTSLLTWVFIFIILYFYYKLLHYIIFHFFGNSCDVTLRHSKEKWIQLTIGF